MSGRAKPAIGDLPYWPRLLDSHQSAAYLGISENTFRALVAAGTFARPLRLGRDAAKTGRGGCRALWDRLQLDRDVDGLGPNKSRVLTEEDLLKVVRGQHDNEAAVDALHHP